MNKQTKNPNKQEKAQYSFILMLPPVTSGNPGLSRGESVHIYSKLQVRITSHVLWYYLLSLLAFSIMSVDGKNEEKE
jgi:hypothetical protein